MSKIITVIGGTSSGKSNFAQNLAIKMGQSRIYLATSEITDDDMREKIRKHIENRKNLFETIENYDSIDKIIDDINADVCLIECITNMINNLMYHSDIDFEKCNNYTFDSFCIDIKKYVQNIIRSMKKSDSDFVIVTNEMSLAPINNYRYTRRFVELQGQINQMITDICDEVYFVVAGIPVRIK